MVKLGMAKLSSIFTVFVDKSEELELALANCAPKYIHINMKLPTTKEVKKMIDNTNEFINNFMVD